jgi:hypothetical protein
MAKTKHQIFVDPRASEYFDSLRERFGWTGGDAVERLVLFYREAQKAIEGLALDEGSEEDGFMPEFDQEGREVWPLVIRKKTGEAAPCGPFEDLARVVFGGLVPVQGFTPFGED